MCKGMFGNPVAASNGNAIFYLVWTYNTKAVYNQKKAFCVCEGSTRSGQVFVLTETYTNCVKQTSAWLFYAVAAAENLLVFGGDVSNAFAEAPPPKQPFFVRPDQAFHEWWVQLLKIWSHPPWTHHPSPVGHARTSGVAQTMGKTRQ
jgi:hypothetical protein